MPAPLRESPFTRRLGQRALKPHPLDVSDETAAWYGTDRSELPTLEALGQGRLAPNPLDVAYETARTNEAGEVRGGVEG